MTQQVVTGIGASKGTATGPARVIRDPSELGRVREGDVLITPMTSPDYIPAFGRIAAVVTDSGGPTCHAAIVSRELKLPCVVGTLIATSVIRDGDMVTVIVESRVGDVVIN